MDNEKLVEKLVELYVHNCNMHKDVGLSVFRKHILGEDDSDVILKRQATINQMIIKLLEEIEKKPVNLSYHVSPFFISKKQIMNDLQN